MLVGALGAGIFGVGTTDGIVVCGMSGGPYGDLAGACGAIVVTTEGEGISGSPGVVTGSPTGDSGRLETGAEGVAAGEIVGAWKNALASCAINSGEKGKSARRPGSSGEGAPSRGRSVIEGDGSTEDM